MASDAQREFDTAERIAEKYRSRGYDVIVEPSAKELPKFLKDFHPDLIAIGATDCVVVEIKRSGMSLDERLLERLASVVSETPKWQFELVVEGPGDMSVPVSLGKLPKPSDIESQFTKVKLLISNGEKDLAIMLLWAAIEATLRWFAQENNVEIKDTELGGVLLKKGLANGLVTKEEFETFERVYSVRNKVAHGMFHQRIDVRTMQNALRSAKKLLGETAHVP